MTSWDRAPPSDHRWKAYDPPARVCGDGTDTVTRDPTITVVVNGVADVRDPSASCSTGRRGGSGIGTGRGTSRRVPVAVRPPESVAVSRSSRWAGYSWSSATKLPLAPDSDVTVCA